MYYIDEDESGADLVLKLVKFELTYMQQLLSQVAPQDAYLIEIYGFWPLIALISFFLSIGKYCGRLL